MVRLSSLSLILYAKLSDANSNADTLSLLQTQATAVRSVHPEEYTHDVADGSEEELFQDADDVDLLERSNVSIAYSSDGDMLPRWWQHPCNVQVTQANKGTGASGLNGGQGGNMMVGGWACSYFQTWTSDKPGVGFRAPACPKTVLGWRYDENFKRRYPPLLTYEAEGLAEAEKARYETFPLANMPQADMGGQCNQIVLPSSTKYFNDALAKFGCVQGQPTNGLWPQNNKDVEMWIHDPSKKGTSKLEYDVDDCRKDAEADPNCAGANIYWFNVMKRCVCKAGVTLVSNAAPGRDLLCALKSKPASEHPFRPTGVYANPFNNNPNGQTGPQYLTGPKNTPKLTSCSKGWAFSGVARELPLQIPSHNTFTYANEVQGARFSYYDKSKTTPSVYRINGKGGRLSAKDPAMCAQSVEDAIKDPSHGCFGASYAAMRGSKAHAGTGCVCVWGDPEPDFTSKGPYDDGKFNKMDAGTNFVLPADGWGWFFCKPDGGDYSDGVEFLPPAKASGIFSPEGPQPVEVPPMTPEEKAKCKEAKKNRKDLRKAAKDDKAEMRRLRELFKAAKLKAKASRSAMLANKDTLANCQR